MKDTSQPQDPFGFEACTAVVSDGAPSAHARFLLLEELIVYYADEISAFEIVSLAAGASGRSSGILGSAAEALPA